MKAAAPVGWLGGVVAAIPAKSRPAHKERADLAARPQILRLDAGSSGDFGSEVALGFFDALA
jgi:hypothetical protein